MAAKKSPHSGTKKNTKSSTGKPASAPKKSTAQKTKKAVSTPSNGRLWSILVFALAMLLAAMTWIPGEAVWAAIREFFFGLFGWVLYLVTPAMVYIAVLVAAGKPWKLKLTVSVLVVLLLCAVALVFTKYTPGDNSFGTMIKEVYALGAQHKGGGFFAIPLGLSLLVWTGRPAANILLIILLIVFLMVLTDVTPADIWYFLRRKAGSAKRSAELALSEREQRRAERLAEAERLAAEAAEDDTFAGKERSRPKVDPQLPQETLDRPRDRWNIDVNVAEDVQVTPAKAEAPAPAAKLETAKGQAFDPADHRELAGVLNHDMLAAAGRQALQPKPKKQADGHPFVTEMEPCPAALAPVQEQHKPLFDQEESSRPLPGGGVFMRANEPDEIYEGTVKPLMADNTIFLDESVSAAEPAAKPDTEAAVQSAAPTGEPANASGEIDDLIRRALDGRPPEDDGTAPDTAAQPAAVQPEPEPEPAIPAPPPYHLPSPELLDRQSGADQGNVNNEMRQNAQILVNTLESFGVKTRVLDICRGPSVTRYELQPLAGVKISRITNLADDIALNLASAGVRIEAPIPGKPAVGIEVPNKARTTVALRSLIQSEEFSQSVSPLTMCLGRDIAGSVKLADLTKMPHLLIAGSTGSGKSVCVNSIIMSFLYKSTPDELRLILIDPKVVELAEYNGIPHLLMPVVTEPKKAAGALGCAVAEMERRYQLFAANNVRDIKSFNRLAESREGLEKIPYIAIIIDELADLMMVAGKQVEDYICRIAQKARAAGMHLIVATQRPSVDVITGLIKANIPSRIAFAVSSRIDSRTILDGAGAEKLLGAGDMLFLPVGAAKPVRIQGTFVKDSEIERVLNEIKSYADARYDEQMIAETDRRAAAAESGGKEGAEGGDEDAQDPMLRSAIETVVEAGLASTSLLQRKLKLGYARAARIMDEMEALHVIGPYEGSKPRQVLITRDQFLEMTMNGRSE